MAASPIVEFLMSLSTPTQGALVQLAVNQVIIPVFPPGVVLNFSTSPSPLYIATIEFRTSVYIIPDTFRLEGMASGVKYIEGLMTGDGREMDYFVLTTVQSPGRISISNISALNQRWVSNSFFLGIPSLVQLSLINEALSRVFTPVKELELLQAILETGRNVERKLP